MMKSLSPFDDADEVIEINPQPKFHNFIMLKWQIVRFTVTKEHCHCSHHCIWLEL